MGEPGEPLEARYAPLWIGGSIRGRVRRDLLPLIAPMPELMIAADGLALVDAGLERAARSRRLQALARRLHAAGIVADWRDERSSVLDDQETEIARCERGVFRTLGIRNRAVHVNGFRADGRIWVSRRSERKRSDPLRLDNLAAGGVSAGESLQRCAVRELWEEAGVPPRLARSLQLPGVTIRSLREVRFGLHDETIVVADLALPEAFEPHNHDGEVAEFLLLEAEEVLRRLEAREFTTEAALTMRDFLRRREEKLV